MLAVFVVAFHMLAVLSRNNLTIGGSGGRGKTTCCISPQDYEIPPQKRLISSLLCYGFESTNELT